MAPMSLWRFWLAAKMGLALLVAAMVLTVVLTPGLSQGDDLMVDQGNSPYNLTRDITYDTEEIGVTTIGSFFQAAHNNTVNLSLYLGENSGSTGTYLLSGTGTLSASEEHIGYFGSGSFNQTGGSNTVGDLHLGNNSASSGTYDLSGTGSLSAVVELIGLSGRGAFTQTGGSNAVVDLCLGNNSGGNSTYTQSGGTNTVSGSLYLGYSTGGSGTYNLGGAPLVNGASLSAVQEYIGYSGSGTFIQNGGTNTVTAVTDSLYLGYNSGSSGTYNLSLNPWFPGLPSLSVAGDEYIGFSGSGTFNQSGGIHTVTHYLYLGYNSGSSGTYNLSGGSLSADFEEIGLSGTGAFTQSGGTHTVTSSLFLGNNSGSSGTYTQSGGTNTVAGGLYLGLYAGSSGYYELSGGSLSVGWAEAIGSSGTGTFNQRGGTHTTPFLYLGWNTGSSGTYYLFGGSLVAASEIIGASGTGTFIHTESGSNTVTNSLVLGDSPGSNGTYTLSRNPMLPYSPSLSVTGNESIGNSGTGIFTQSAGTHTITSTSAEIPAVLYLGYYSGSSGTYTLSGGSLAAMIENIGLSGTGTFTQNGGTNTVTGTSQLAGNLYLGYYAGSSGTYTLNDGSLAVADNIEIGFNSGSQGTFKLLGGKLTAGTIDLNTGGTFQNGSGHLDPTTFNQRGGTLLGGLQNRGQFNYYGGVFSGSLFNYGGVTFYADFTVGQQLNNYANLDIPAGRTVTVNGPGLLNEGTLTMSGGTLGGSAPLTNNNTWKGYGTINANGGLNNNKNMTFTGGPSTVNGSVYNGDDDNPDANLYIKDPANFTGNVTNYGMIKTTGTTFNCSGTFNNAGAYISDPATQTFNNLTVQASGYLKGGAGDTFIITGDFINKSINSSWNTSAATLKFVTGTTNSHEFQISGGLGNSISAFSWGILDITGQVIDLIGGSLYVGELLGADHESNLITNIWLENPLDIYYNPDLPENAYLGDRIWELEGGGYLRPTPLPPSAWLFLSGLAGLGLLGRRRKV